MQNEPMGLERELKRLAGVVSRLEDRIAAVEDELAAERRAREALEERLAGRERAGRHGASSEPARPEPAALASEDDPQRLRSVLADWGFGARSRQKTSTEAPAWPARSPAPQPVAKAPAASSAPPKPSAPTFSEIEAPSSSPAPQASPPPPKVAVTRPPFNALAPTVMDALERDGTITPGQRETLRMIYVRFFPDAAPNPAVTLAEGTTVGDVLETDPNLQHGQREALRTMYNSFGVHRRKAT